MVCALFRSGELVKWRDSRRVFVREDLKLPTCDGPKKAPWELRLDWLPWDRRPQTNQFVKSEWKLRRRAAKTFAFNIVVVTADRKQSLAGWQWGCVSIQGLHTCKCALKGRPCYNVAQKTVPIHRKSKDTPNAHLKCALLFTDWSVHWKYTCRTSVSHNALHFTDKISYALPTQH